MLYSLGFVFNCNDQQVSIKGQCCDSCQPGYRLEKFCTEHQQTVCKPCEVGFFSEKHSIFDLCEECDSCEQEYAEKCTATANAKCSCRPGFLCSNNICSECEKDKCVSGEKLKRTDVAGVNLIKYTYECEPICLEHAYYDEKKNTCIPRTMCSAFGLVELFAGNKTHNSICQMHEMGSMYVVVITGFVLLSVTILVILSYHCRKNLKRFKASKNIAEPIVVTATDRCQLSKEETLGIIQLKVDSFG